MRELPDEEDGEEGDAGPLDDAACGSPADEWWERSGEGSNEGVDGGDALEWGVDGDVADCGEESEGSGEEIGGVREVERAEKDCCKAEDQAVGERDAACCHGARGGAAHECVGFALEGLIERAAAAGDDGDSCESMEEASVEGADAAAEAAEVEACSGSDDDHGGDTELEERGVVGEQGMGLRGREDCIGCRGGSHRVRITRLRRGDGVGVAACALFGRQNVPIRLTRRVWLRLSPRVWPVAGAGGRE